MLTYFVGALDVCLKYRTRAHHRKAFHILKYAKEDFNLTSCKSLYSSTVIIMILHLAKTTETMFGLPYM